MTTESGLPYFPAAMSTPQRIAVIAAGLVVAIVAFVIAGSGGDDEPQRSSATTSEQTDTGNDSAEPQASEPKVTRIQIEDGAVVGGAKTIDVVKGDTVRIVVSANAPDDIHLHGYDIERSVDPGRPARFRFKVDAEGAFEIESHVAEDAGRDPLVARVVVSPS
jgi:FtsP/CotA-like multicopper oxidase with cupredoxin domain